MNTYLPSKNQYLRHINTLFLNLHNFAFRKQIPQYTETTQPNTFQYITNEF